MRVIYFVSDGELLGHLSFAPSSPAHEVVHCPEEDVVADIWLDGSEIYRSEKAIRELCDISGMLEISLNAIFSHIGRAMCAEEKALKLKGVLADGT